MTRAPAPTRPRLSTPQQALLGFFWFAMNVQYAAILIITMPSQVRAAVGDDAKGSALGLALAAGAFVSMLAAPVFGALSDRIRLPGGRRKPWIVIGTLGDVACLAGMATLARPGEPGSLVGWSVAFLLYQLFNNVATAPYAAMIPDMVAPEQRGSASGWMGLMTMLGSFAGGVLGFLIDPLGGIAGVYGVVIAVTLAGLVVTLLGVRELPAPAVLPRLTARDFLRGLIDPFRHADFAWVFFTRLLVTMGVYTVQEFLQYYLGDVIGAPFALPGVGVVADTPEEAVSFFLLPLLLGALASTLAAGVLSDRYGRKRMVYLAGGLMGAVALVFVASHSFALAVLMGVVFGLGYGAYESVDWALASDVLLSMDDYARDMGVWHVAMVLPQVIATPVAGFLLDNFQRAGRAQGLPNLGYTVIFLMAVVYFALGTVFVNRIKRAR